MPASIIDPAATLEVARSAMKRAQEAYELSARNSARIDELEHSSARTVESMKAMFATAVRENSAEQATALKSLTKRVDEQTTSLNTVIVSLNAQASVRSSELRTNRVLFAILVIAASCIARCGLNP